MNVDIIDVSVSLGDGLPVWPGSPGVSTRPLLRRADGDIANASELRTDVHCGTHVDAPRHFVDDGATIDQLSLSSLNGPALVVELPTAVESIGAADLATAVGPQRVERLLLKTRNSDRPELYQSPFWEEYSALAPDGAMWMREREVRVVGIDYLSIQRFNDPPDTHEILLHAGIAIVEGLNLAPIAPGWHELICMPILINGAEAAPARAALRPL